MIALNLLFFVEETFNTSVNICIYFVRIKFEYELQTVSVLQIILSSVVILLQTNRQNAETEECTRFYRIVSKNSVDEIKDLNF